jgi:hypothetical protein
MTRALWVVLLVLLPGSVPAQPPVIPYIYPVPGDLSGVAAWELPHHEDRRATIVTGLPVPLRYRICNESNTPAVVTTDASPKGFDLPPRSCVDVGARSITISQREAGIPAKGSYLRLD